MCPDPARFRIVLLGLAPQAINISHLRCFLEPAHETFIMQMGDQGTGFLGRSQRVAVPGKR
jgi:hypothetical protein